MTKTIVKVDEKTVATVEQVERRNIYPKKQLIDERAAVEKRLAEIDELLAVLTA